MPRKGYCASAQCAGVQTREKSLVTSGQWVEAVSDTASQCGASAPVMHTTHTRCMMTESLHLKGNEYTYATSPAPHVTPLSS